MHEPNKLMVKIMEKIVKFDCQKCNRYWSFEDYQMHEIRGNCMKDPYASNQTEALNKNQQSMSIEEKKIEQEMPKIEFDDVEMDDQSLSAIDQVFICEKDSKSVLVYDIAANSHEKRPIDMDSNFMHNFQYVQTTDNRLFVLGGGDIKKPDDEKLKACFEIIVKQSEQDKGKPLKAVKQKSMQFARHGHSVCAIKDRFLVVTGSRVEAGQASSSVEFYNIQMNTWFT